MVSSTACCFGLALRHDNRYEAKSFPNKKRPEGRFVQKQWYLCAAARAWKKLSWGWCGRAWSTNPFENGQTHVINPKNSRL